MPPARQPVSTSPSQPARVLREPTSIACCLFPCGPEHVFAHASRTLRQNLVVTARLPTPKPGRKADSSCWDSSSLC